MSENQTPTQPKLPKWAKSKDELAQILAVSRATVQRAAAIDGWPKAMADGRWPVEKCRAFIVKHFDVLKDVGSALPEGFTSWPEFKAAQQGMRESVKLAHEKNEAVSRSHSSTTLARGLIVLCSFLNRRLCSELPPVTAGQDAITIETRNREALSEAFREARSVFGGLFTASDEAEVEKFFQNGFKEK